MKFNWLPWKFIIKAVARKHGFVDPIIVLSHLNKFSQPSEVAEPIELLRAGVIFHARGLINSRVIQHNLDWVWPYWVERQFDPFDISFVPRAFSITHVNLTHRNWSAIGVPNYSELPIVDPRGLLTPFFDKWSLDAWIVTEDGRELLPSRAKNARQYLDYHQGVQIVTEINEQDLALISFAKVALDENKPICTLKVSASANSKAWLVISLRPYNPEGVSFVYNLKMSQDRKEWTIDKKNSLYFSSSIDRNYCSIFKNGDVHIHLHDLDESDKKHCDIGLVTGAALFKIEPQSTRTIDIQIPLINHSINSFQTNLSNTDTLVWEKSLIGETKCALPDKHINYLFESSVRTIILCSPREVFPGPYTYKRFWYRDAAFVTCGLLYAGLVDRAEQSLQYFPSQQAHNGYFHSQEGEWDSNGEVLWILRRFFECCGRLPKDVDWWPVIKKAGKWIINKRRAGHRDKLHSGLLPAGFSAEHLGPNDYYYWDDFWSVSGLQAAAFFADYFDEKKSMLLFTKEADQLMHAIERSLKVAAKQNKIAALPASPTRRLDSGAIGSLAAGYPLQLFSCNDERLMNTVEFILQNCSVANGFFQDMIHSGINPYLTLHVAQVLLRADDPRYFDLLQRVAELASPTGLWPEAIHTHTQGGCMGDGQHAWAAAEWIIMLRNCFVREEENSLVVVSGISQQWLADGKEISFGPTPTSFGEVFIRVQQIRDKITLSWQANWRKMPEKIEVRLPGIPVSIHTANDSPIVIERPKLV